MKPTINRIFTDRRAAKPHWYCRISGGVGVNREDIIGSAYGCCPRIACWKARWAYWKAKRKYIQAHKTKD